MGERVAILGMGVSGQAAAALAHAKGDTPVIFDENAETGGTVLRAEALAEVDRIVISPGFAREHPWRQLANFSAKPCLGETAYAAESWRGRIYGVTGTNGKTSLTQLLTAALNAAGVDAVACGNIGVPLSAAVASASNQSEAVAVCELSSFQAELTEGLYLDALIWTNFAPDHLDRYEDAAEYFSAKWGLVKCLKPESPYIYGREVALAMQAHQTQAEGTPVTSSDVDCAGLALDSPFQSPPQNENLALVQALWGSLGLNPQALLHAAQKFALPEFRLQVVAEIDGVRYWNDSKATNFHAVRAALSAMPREPVFWIGGGRSKGEDPAKLAASLKGRISRACVYGENALELVTALTAVGVPVEHAADCGAAIEAASRRARKEAPAQVLFSPGFASFDFFESYKTRGKYFNSVVLSL
ncbi:MAG: UDP-N-acetylmuramoyl-L-alanine--D-glutamate ligase [Verrucomicrobia bacterium]|nr:UDP-N-acetylmuramoyl-L-alanine--D-glutamate ligase [Verrucomicrobiota bacterium]